MNFPGGACALPDELLLSGKSGVHQVAAPEQPVPLARMSDAALQRFAEDLATLFETETRDDADAAVAEYVDLLFLQVTREILSRSF